jgi:hypothetical protein
MQKPIKSLGVYSDPNDTFQFLSERSRHSCGAARQEILAATQQSRRLIMLVQKLASQRNFEDHTLAAFVNGALRQKQRRIPNSSRVTFDNSQQSCHSHQPETSYQL